MPDFVRAIFIHCSNKNRNFLLYKKEGRKRPNITIKTVTPKTFNLFSIVFSFPIFSKYIEINTKPAICQYKNFLRCSIYPINIHPHSGWFFSFGHSPALKVAPYSANVVCVVHLFSFSRKRIFKFHF